MCIRDRSTVIELLTVLSLGVLVFLLVHPTDIQAIVAKKTTTKIVKFFIFSFLYSWTVQINKKSAIFIHHINYPFTVQKYLFRYKYAKNSTSNTIIGNIN